MDSDARLGEAEGKGGKTECGDKDGGIARSHLYMRTGQGGTRRARPQCDCIYTAVAVA